MSLNIILIIVYVVGIFISSGLCAAIYEEEEGLLGLYICECIFWPIVLFLGIVGLLFVGPHLLFKWLWGKIL